MEYVIVIVQFFVLVNGNESGAACNMLANMTCSTP